jgi:hypothetical protein
VPSVESPGSSWLSSLTREGSVPLCHSRVTARLQPPEEPRNRARGHHL